MKATLIVSQQTVHTEQTHNAEVTKYFQHVCSTMVIIAISGCKSEISILFLIKDLKDHWLLNQCLEVVQHSNNIPDLQKKRAKDRSQVTDTMCSNQVADYRVHTMKKKLLEHAALGWETSSICLKKASSWSVFCFNFARYWQKDWNW